MHVTCSLFAWIGQTLPWTVRHLHPTEKRPRYWISTSTRRWSNRLSSRCRNWSSRLRDSSGQLIWRHLSRKCLRYNSSWVPSLLSSKEIVMTGPLVLKTPVLRHKGHHLHIERWKVNAEGNTAFDVIEHITICISLMIIHVSHHQISYPSVAIGRTKRYLALPFSTQCRPTAGCAAPSTWRRPTRCSRRASTRKW